MDEMNISLSGLDVESQRLQIVAQNLANVNSTRTESGDPYRPLRLLSGPNASFEATLNQANAALGPGGVHVVGVEPIANGLRRTYEPNHPHADGDGFVSYPNISHAGEMALMIRASRAYEANLAAASIALDMYTRALSLGQRS